MEELVMFDKPYDQDRVRGFYALLLAIALAVSPLSGVLGTEAI
jgi:hypothetical protein